MSTQRTAEQADKNREADRAAVMAHLLGNANGRAHVWATLEQCGIFKTSFAVEQPTLTAFNEGQRNVGLRLLADVMEFDANALTIMRAEDKQRQERYHVIAPERDVFDE